MTIEVATGKMYESRRDKTRHQKFVIQSAKQILAGSAASAAQIVSDLITGDVGRISATRWEAVKLCLAYHLGTPKRQIEVTGNQGQMTYNQIIVLAEQRAGQDVTLKQLHDSVPRLDLLPEDDNIIEGEATEANQDDTANQQDDVPPGPPEDNTEWVQTNDMFT